MEELEDVYIRDLFTEEHPLDDDEVAWYRDFGLFTRRSLRNDHEDESEGDLDALLHCYAISLHSKDREVSRKQPTIDKRISWGKFVDSVAPTKFRKMFRLDKESFDILLEKVKPRITTKNQAQAMRAHKQGPVTPETRLATTLRFLAGGSPWDIATIFSVCEPELYRSLWVTVDAINHEFAMTFPQTLEDCIRVEKGFCAKSKNQCLRGCIGALDGCIFEVRNPGKQVK